MADQYHEIAKEITLKAIEEKAITSGVISDTDKDNEKFTEVVTKFYQDIYKAVAESAKKSNSSKPNVRTMG